MDEIQELLKKSGPGQMSSTAYDTAWIARLGDMDHVLSNRAIEWICDNQLSDGSWGTKDIYYYHDRVISTLSAMISLTHRGRRAYDKVQIERGLLALEHVTSGATQGLMADPMGATAGFEMIVPTLIAEAEKLGILQRQGDRILDRLARQRQAKIDVLKNRKINRHMAAAFSIEMAGSDGKNILELDNIQEEDGSISHSPSATAYYLLKIDPQNTKALEYLQKTSDAKGGIPMAAPFEICERAWVLWNLRLLESLDSETLDLCKPHLDELQNAWKPGKGVGFTREHSVFDGDDTSLTFDVLQQFGYSTDLETLLVFEEADHFRSYSLEIAFSVSTNVHFLGALRNYGYKVDSPLVQKAMQYIYKTQINESYWLDKWHISPYYTTSHAVIICSGYHNDLIKKSVEWMINTQNKDGSWGFYSVPTSEETSYALQALAIWKKNGGNVDKNVLTKGLAWLNEHDKRQYPQLWIAKSLNYSEWILQAAILSAKGLVAEALG